MTDEEMIEEVMRRYLDIGDRSKWVSLEDYIACLTPEQRADVERARAELKRRMS